MNEKLVISSSPHIRGPQTVSSIMRDVVFALMPACIASIIFFGMQALMVIAASVISAVVSEALYEKAVKRPVTINDFSAVITGILLALTLPPGVPVWIPVIGSAFAIIIAKQIFGGLGCNFVNPALAARAFLLAAWPMHLTRDWLTPLTFDAATTATPLAVMQATARGTVPGLFDLLIGNRLGSIGETSIIAILLGGCYLLAKNVIDPSTPLGYIATVFVGSWIFGNPAGFFQGDALTLVMLGGVFLAAFFMATDYVTSPVTPAGRLLMGIGAGFITILIRHWGGYPEGVTYGILFMNLLTPLLDRFVVPRYYGHKHDMAKPRQGAGGR
jgi:electron transport complex protein RnfD